MMTAIVLTLTLMACVIWVVVELIIRHRRNRHFKKWEKELRVGTRYKPDRPAIILALHIREARYWQMSGAFPDLADARLYSTEQYRSLRGFNADRIYITPLAHDGRFFREALENCRIILARNSTPQGLIWLTRDMENY